MVKRPQAHHKYSDTDCDPHNARRGLFYTHIGWIMLKKSDEVLSKVENIDLSDLGNDSVVMFQKKTYHLWTVLWCYVIPPLIPWYFWNEDIWLSFIVMGVMRQALTFHFWLLGNSVGHKYGNRPFDKNILPVNSEIMNIIAIGEGWHNFHHVFPWDYRSAEVGNYKYNFTTGFIELMRKIGWAYDLKAVSADVVRKRALRTGDGTLKGYDMENQEGDVWGWGDGDMKKEEVELVCTFNKIK
ncbi:hypothetical protein NQ318_021355 [Aromia moschata]|uniref:Fatty acid desaturase domain-containing protein n=1 Tax=Aromia moschata TaxID=1265417 RepID=A0AAV8ZDQ3_9CUCU|nr:hypothetical protein NQ318_021355 [Aromia moschata]